MPGLLIYILNFNTENLIYINILIAIFNLLPIYPLDGGRIVNGVLKCWLTPIKAQEIVFKITKVSLIILTLCASILVFYFENIWIFIAIIYMWLGVIFR